MQIKFEWDLDKARINLAKHGVSFEEARSVFYDPLVDTFLDKAHSDKDNRFISIGMSAKSRLLLVVHSQRDTEIDTVVIRIISCRKATPLERRKYEEGED